MGSARDRASTQHAVQAGFRPDIEGLRGISVALVVAYHATTLSSSRFQLAGGFVGVDVFFVISGFLITGLLIREHEQTGRTSFTEFYARRVRRILPAALTTLLVTLPLTYWLVNSVDRPIALFDGVSAALSVANVRFLDATSYFQQNAGTQLQHYSPFLQFWTLSVEEQFYLFWPAILALAWKFGRLNIALVTGAIVLTSFAGSLAISDGDPSFVFYMLPGRAWELGIGGLLAIAWGSYGKVLEARTQTGRGALALMGWAALVALAIAACDTNAFRMSFSPLTVVIPVLAGVILIATGMVSNGPGLLLTLAPVRFLGRISYSLYLWHWPVLILGGLVLVGPWDVLSPAQAAFLVALAVLCSWLSWMVIEAPIHRRRFRVPQSRLVLAGANAAGAVAIVGFGLTASAVGAIDPPATAQDPFSVATVSPALDRATVDYDFSCIDLPAPLPRPAGCVWGNPSGAQTIALVGDSHAGSLSPALKPIAVAHGWRLLPYLKSACPFVDMRVQDGNRSHEFTDCATWNRSVVDDLKKEGASIVIVSMSRLFYPMDANDDVASQAQALVRMIQRVPATTRVVIVEDTPMADKELPQCLAAHSSDYRECSYSREVGFRLDMGVRERVAAAATGAGLIDLTDAICPGTGSCPAVIDHKIVFMDSSHMTATFAASLAPTIDVRLTAILDNPSNRSRTSVRTRGVDPPVTSWKGLPAMAWTTEL